MTVHIAETEKSDPGCPGQADRVLVSARLRRPDSRQ